MVGSIPSSFDSTVVELTVDRYGHVSDWKMLRGELTSDVKSVISLSNFNPGTYFGIPTDSKIVVSLHSPLPTRRGANRSRVARQRLGQHFLIKGSVLERIARATCPIPNL
jgi:hypothetical protein